MDDGLATEEERSDRYEEILMNIQDAVYTLDAQGRITWVNRPAVENYDIGYTRDDLIGSNVSKVLDQDDIDKAAAVIQQLLEDDDREKGRCQIGIHTAHGREIPCDLHLSLLPFEDGEFQGTLGVLRDIREQKQREQRLAVFNRVLRHNVRNHMAVILGQAADLERGLEGEAAEKAATIHDRGERLTSLAAKARTIEEILDDHDYAVEPVDVPAVVRNRVQAFRQRHSEVTITLTAPDAKWAMANETLGLAVGELLENAVEHNSDPIRIDVSITASDSSDWVDITVQDNGAGIPTDEITVIEGEIETQLQHASGLGLWFVNWLVDRYGGSLTFEPGDDRGNAVTISLPPASPPE